nr:DedA family protein [Clostridia bacterium]
MNEIILQIMDKFGYFGIAFLIAIENVFPPIPSEVILTFGGFMTSNTNMTITGVIIVSTIGSVIGAIILYLLGRLLTKERLYKLVDGRIGKILRFKKQDIDKSEEWFSKKGKSTVLFCRFIPMVRSLISIPAGMTKMEFSLFLTYTIIGSAIWNSVLTYLGFAAGNAWESVAKYVDYFAKITLIMFACVVCVCGFIVYKKRKFEKLR